MDYYAILEIKYGATQDEIKRAFHRLAHIHHPDKGGDVKKFQQINRAYQELKKSVHAGSHSTYTPPRRPAPEPTVHFWQGATHWSFDSGQPSQEQMEHFLFDLMQRMKQNEQIARNKRAQAEAMRNQYYSADIEKKRQAMADILRDAAVFPKSKKWSDTNFWR